MRRLPLVLAATVLLAVSACSSDSDDAAPSDTTAGNTSSTATATSDTTAASEPVDQTAPTGGNGITIDDEGCLWVAVMNDDEVLKINPDDGTILARYAMPDGTGPDDLAIDDGGAYITGFTSGDVLVLDLDSGDVTSIGSIGAGANPIAVRPGGGLIVGRAITATGLFAVDPSGDKAPVALGDPGNVNSFSFGADRVLYGPLSAPDGGSIVAIDADTGTVTSVIARVTGFPSGVRVHDGMLYALVTDGTSKVQKIDPATGTVTLFGDTGLALADNLAVGVDGEVYVTGFNTADITVLGADGAVERTITMGG